MGLLTGVHVCCVKVETATVPSFDEALSEEEWNAELAATAAAQEAAAREAEEAEAAAAAAAASEAAVREAEEAERRRQEQLARVGWMCYRDTARHACTLT
jgi:hypothetical protein